MPRTIEIDAPIADGKSSSMPWIASWVSTASHAASDAAFAGLAPRPAMARASKSPVHTQRIPRL
ncbi:hypothetical protein D3C83_285480 [compost metagenome]